MLIVNIINIYILLLSLIYQFSNEISEPSIIHNSGREPYLAIDKNDRLHLVFVDRILKDNNSADIYYMNFNGEHWTRPVNLSNTNRLSRNPELVIDHNNVIHIYWDEVCHPQVELCSPDLYYSYYEREAWTEPINIYHSTDTTHYLKHSNFILDQDNQFHLMLKDRSGQKYLKIKKGITSILKIANRKCTAPYIHFGNTGIFHVAFIGVIRDSTIKRGRSDVCYFANAESDTIWPEPVLVYHDKDHYSHKPKIITDNRGRIHIIWMQDEGEGVLPSDIYHAFSDDGINWSEAVDVSHANNICLETSITMDSRNLLHVVWSQSLDNSLDMDHVRYAFYNGESWSEPKQITPSGKKMGYSPSIAVDSKDNLHVVWVGKLSEEDEPGLVYKSFRLD